MTMSRAEVLFWILLMVGMGLWSVRRIGQLPKGSLARFMWQVEALLTATATAVLTAALVKS